MYGRWLQVLVVTSLAMAALELVNMFMIEVPAAAAVFAVAYLGGVVWLVRRSGLWAAVLLGVLNLVELAFLPAYSRNTTTDWVLQVLVLVLAGAGLAAAVVVGRGRRRLGRRGPATQAA